MPYKLFRSSAIQPAAEKPAPGAVGHSIATQSPKSSPPITQLLAYFAIEILIVDNETAFCGGMNIAKEYAGTELNGTGASRVTALRFLILGSGEFRDTIVKVEGPAVKDLEQVFLSSLDESGYMPQYPFKDRYQVVQGSGTTGIMQRMSDAMKHDKESVMEEWRRELPPVWANTNSDAVLDLMCCCCCCRCKS